MTKRAWIAGMVALVALSACSREPGERNRFNPLTWFDTRDVQDTLVPVDQRLSVDNRKLVQQITDISIEPTPGGVIIVATGLPPTQGYWQTDLVLDTREGLPTDGVLRYQFRIAPPLSGVPTQTGNTRTNTVDTASGATSGGFSFGGQPRNQTQVQVVSAPTGTPRTRSVTAAIFLTEQQLREVREVQIVAASNARTLRR